MLPPWQKLKDGCPTAQPSPLGVKIPPLGLGHILSSPCQSPPTSCFNVAPLQVVPALGLGSPPHG